MTDKPCLVIKIGGNEFSQPGFIPMLAAAVKSRHAEADIVLVHGGGKAVSDMMAALTSRKGRVHATIAAVAQPASGPDRRQATPPMDTTMAEKRSALVALPIHTWAPKIL